MNDVRGWWVAAVCLGVACGDDGRAPGGDGSTGATGGDDAPTSAPSSATTESESSPTSNATTNDDDADDSSDTGEPTEPPPTTVFRPGSADIVTFPQYLSMRKSPTQLGDAAHEARCLELLPELEGLPFLGNANTCTIFHPNNLDALPTEDDRRTFFTAGFEEVRRVVGAEQVGDRWLALEVSLDLFDSDPQRVADYLAAMLEGARASKLPVLVNLDAVNWWGARPDLWNFFDAAAPGYDPENLDNVEWIGPTGDGAPRVFWRNWGAQIRVATPIPNLASPRLREALQDELDLVLPIVRDFVDDLAPDERHRFVGVSIGTELAIGVNHYYYVDGNDVLADAPECDPGLPLAGGCPSAGGPCSAYNRGVCPLDFFGSQAGGGAQLGYHAAIDLGILPGDGVLHREQLDAITADYTAFVRTAIVDAGLPAQRIFSHTGGVFGPNGPHSHEPAGVPGVVPGWSMYYGDTENPAASIGQFVDASAVRQTMPWASPEWLPLDPNGGADGNAWQQAIEGSLDFRNNRMISLANWEGVSVSAGAMAGARGALTTPYPQSCVVVPRAVLGQADIDGGVRLRFSGDRADTVTYLNASGSGELTAEGTLANPDVVNAALDAGVVTWDFAVPDSGATWVQLVTDGCLRDGAVQRMTSPVFMISAETTDGSIAADGRVLFASRDTPIAMLTFDLAAATDEPTLEFSYDADFAVVERSEALAGATAFFRDGFDADHPLYARVVDEGGASNVVVLR